MLDTNEAIYRQYETLGISKEVLDFGTSVEKELKERFDKIDTNAEYNQLKVIAAMQKKQGERKSASRHQAATATMTSEGIHLRECTQTVLAQKMHL